MVNRLRLNDKTVREQIPEEERAYQVFDTEIRGLSIRVMPSGARFRPRNILSWRADSPSAMNAVRYFLPCFQ